MSRTKHDPTPMRAQGSEMTRFHVYPRESAMHGAIEFHTRRWGWVVIKPPMYAFGRWWKWCIYASPDATPYRCTFAFGPGMRDA